MNLRNAKPSRPKVLGSYRSKKGNGGRDISGEKGNKNSDLNTGMTSLMESKLISEVQVLSHDQKAAKSTLNVLHNQQRKQVLSQANSTPQASSADNNYVRRRFTVGSTNKKGNQELSHTSVSSAGR